MKQRIKLPAPVAAIYRAVEELEAAYPLRKFTPDGHLVGSIGEVIAAEALSLTLHPASYPGHDAFDGNGNVIVCRSPSIVSQALYISGDPIRWVSEGRRHVSSEVASTITEHLGQEQLSLRGRTQSLG
jgi:Family of unknown function (DUF6998)